MTGALHRLQERALMLGVEAQIRDPVFLKPGTGAIEIAGIDIDRQDLEIFTAEFRLYGIERRHFLPAGCAPGRPEVHQYGTTGKIRKREGFPVGPGELHIGGEARDVMHIDGGKLAPCMRRETLDHIHRRLADFRHSFRCCERRA